MQNDENDQYKDLLKDIEIGDCQNCGGALVIEKVNLEDYQGGKLYMMESIPAFVCQECGEVWVPEPIMKEFIKMIDTAKKLRHHPIKTNKKGGETNGN